MKTCLFRLYPFQDLPFGTGSFSGTVCQICFFDCILAYHSFYSVQTNPPLRQHTQDTFFSPSDSSGLWLNYSYT